MTSTTLFGCAHTRGSLESYAHKFEALELDILDKPQRPRTPTLRKWRREAGPTLVFSLVAPAVVCAARPGPALDAGIEAFLAAQRTLEARWLVVPTPLELTPSALQRERLAAVVGRIRAGLGDAKDVVHVAWEPKGVWEDDDAVSFAEQLGVFLAADPLLDPRVPKLLAGARYLRVRMVGGRTAFPPARMRALSELLARAERDGMERVVILLTQAASRDAQRLRKLVREGVSNTDLGGATIIHPRGGFASEEEE